MPLMQHIPRNGGGAFHEHQMLRHMNAVGNVIGVCLLGGRLSRTPSAPPGTGVGERGGDNPVEQWGTRVDGGCFVPSRDPPPVRPGPVDRFTRSLASDKCICRGLQVLEQCRRRVRGGRGAPTDRRHVLTQRPRLRLGCKAAPTADVWKEYSSPQNDQHVKGGHFDSSLLGIIPPPTPPASEKSVDAANCQESRASEPPPPPSRRHRPAKRPLTGPVGRARASVTGVLLRGKGGRQKALTRRSTAREGKNG